MLTVTGGAASDCTWLTRRNFLQAGAPGLGGLSLADPGRLIESRKVSFADHQGRPVRLIETGEPIRELFQS